MRIGTATATCILISSVPLLQFTGVIITWAIVHAIMWNGKAVTEEDVPYPVRLLGYLIGSENTTAPAKPKNKLYQTNFGDGPM